MNQHKLTGVSHPKRKQVLELARSKGLLRPRDVAQFGITPEYLNKLHRDGFLERVSRGLYRLPNGEPTQHSQLAEVAKRVPRAVVCLISALNFHDLTTQIPHQLWLAIPLRDRTPRIEYPPLKILRYSDASLKYGVEHHIVDSVDVKIFSPAKSVADCFKFRNQVGLDVAMDALREVWRDKKATADELWIAAKVCRMTNVMRPYLEAVAFNEEAAGRQAKLPSASL